jgi:hypothetical protein
LLVAVLLVSFNFSAAQDAPQPARQQSPPSGLTIDPSAGPLKPSEAPGNAQTPLPDAPQPPAIPAQPPARLATQPAIQEPLGVAAAEQIQTAGGAASRPAGEAIAPARQHQYRSLLIKVGVVAAAGIAAGTVYGLSRATSSTPPHSTAAVAK